MISSRQIERACQENILFIALSYGYAPDHSTIAAFVSSMQDEVQAIFSNVLLVCEEMKLLDGTHFSLDGVKLSANVSKEWSGTLDELKHKRDKLKEKLSGSWPNTPRQTNSLKWKKNARRSRKSAAASGRAAERIPEGSRTEARQRQQRDPKQRCR
jgi:hypothetical protein